MRDGDKYRFNLQFPANTEDAEKVGELLEKLGKRKSAFVVTAIVDYLRNHPDFRIDHPADTPRRIYKAEIEEMIRAIIDEKIAGGLISSDTKNDSDADLTDEVDSDVMTLLGNVHLFE